MSLRIDASNFIKGLSTAKQRTLSSVEAYGRTAAQKLEAEAKRAAPWHDRTGNARQTISNIAEWNGDKYRIGIAGNTNYSPYLEFRWNKRYAVLWPTVERMTPEITQGMSGLF